MKVLLKNGNVFQTASACYRNCEKDWYSFRKQIPFKMMMSDKPKWLFYSTLGKIKCFHSFMTAYRILPESASHTKDYIKAMRYRDNSEEVARYFNKRFVGLDEKELCKGYRVSKCRKVARYSKEDFYESWKQLLRDYPSQIFNIRLDVVAFFRLVLNKII